MHLIKSIFLLIFIVGLVTGFNLTLQANTEIVIGSSSESNYSSINEEAYIEQDIVPRSSASKDNYDIINEILDAKLTEYSSDGYFNQSYESSLQATYYALYILEAIGKLDSVDQDALADYIMSYYDPNTNIFMDKYAYRYLDTDFNKEYFPLTSVLEINSYAILSLAILNKLHLIDIQGSIYFIWSCYNPSTSGFIGRPYGSSPPGVFQTSSMDNTYYAIITLDLLLDWNSYSIEKDSLAIYINSLQTVSGGFLNDFDYEFAFQAPFYRTQIYYQPIIA